MGSLLGRPAAAPLSLAACALAVIALASSCALPSESGSAELDSVYTRLASLEASSPGSAVLRELGLGASEAHPEGDEALPIESIRIRGESWAEGDPLVQVIGSLHGNEPLGAELCLALAELALGRGGAEAPASLAKLALDILPVANPWGYARSSRYVYAGGTWGIDLNRSFPWDYGPGATGPGVPAGSAPTEPEIAALLDDALESRYAMSISLHSGAACVCIPWDYIGTTASLGTAAAYDLGTYINSYSPAHPWFIARGAAYAAMVEAASGGWPGSFPLLQGYDWYYAGGTYGDWLYLKLGVAPFTVELTGLQGGESISESEIAKARSEQLSALVALVASARLGAAGRVVDATGTAVAGARVEASPLSGAKALGWIEPQAFLPFGYSDGSGYFRLALQQGRWAIAATATTAEGYATASTQADIGISGASEGIRLELSAP